jgi:hypothetical protein
MKQVNSPAAYLLARFFKHPKLIVTREKQNEHGSFEVNTSGRVDTVSGVTIYIYLNHVTFDRG